MQNILLNYPNLDVRAGSVFDLVLNPTVPAYESSSNRDVLAAIDGVKLGSHLALSVPVSFPLICHQTLARSSNVPKSSYALARSCLGKSTLVG
jgi:hypothetical protein